MSVLSILKRAVEKGATDIHVLAGRPVMFRIQGDLVSLDSEVLSAEAARNLCFSLLTNEQVRQFETDLDLDFIESIKENRFRINISYSNGTVSAVIRVLNHQPMPLETLKLPPVVTSLCQHDKGLILITGTTSQGKTTTLAGIIDYINRYRNRNIITIEDPIEYVHENKQSIIRQREIGKDTKSFESGLRAALRQDPNVLVIGEMRDYESIHIALTAAETGVLVLSTLHAMSVDKVVERLLSYVPPDQEGQIRLMLAEAFLGIIHQELLPTTNGGKRVACEVVTNTTAIKNTLRKRESYQLQSYIITSEKSHGMRSMKHSLEELLQDGEISEEVFDQVMLSYG